ncbi:hypothetical protein F66182_17647, partial [Fusarium sp. NRRL 66182]
MADPVNTTAETTVETTDGPPPLPYSLRQRKRSIAFFWTLFVIDTLAQPLILYFALRYGTSLSLNLVFSISTAALGGVPLNARKSWVSVPIDLQVKRLMLIEEQLDFFQINFTIVWLMLAVELIV